jgi:uncharacterized membrane protein YiaA
MVIHATSYNVLLGGMILYSIGVILDLWEELHTINEDGK